MARRDTRVLVIGGGLGGHLGRGLAGHRGLRGRAVREERQDRRQAQRDARRRASPSISGPSIIILPHLFRRLFERAGKTMEDYVEFQELQPQWRSFFEDGTVIDLHPDMAHDGARAGEARRGRQRLLGLHRVLAHAVQVRRGGLPRARRRHASARSSRGYGARTSVLTGAPISFASMDGGVARHIKEPHLRDMLNFFIKYVGSSAYDAPALLNLLPYSQLGYGLWYVKGGMYNLARGLEQAAGGAGRRGPPRRRGDSRSSSEGKRVDGRRAGRRRAGPRRRGGLQHGGHPGLQAAARRRRLADGQDATSSIFEPAASGLVVHLGVDREYAAARSTTTSSSPRDPKKHFDTIHHAQAAARGSHHLPGLPHA